MNADEQAGIDWWNGLTDAAKAYWLEQAGGSRKLASVAGAWAACKASGATTRSAPVAEGCQGLEGVTRRSPEA